MAGRDVYTVEVVGSIPARPTALFFLYKKEKCKLPKRKKGLKKKRKTA